MFSSKNDAILGLLLIALGLAILASNLDFFDVGSTILGILLFGGLGSVFLSIYRRGEDNWWAIIPASVLFGLAIVTLMEAPESTPAALSRAVFLWACASPFVLLFRRAPRFFWAILPGGFLIIVGLVALISDTRLGEALLAWLVYWGIGGAFAMIFLRQPARWWSIIPAGAFFSMGIVALVDRAGLGGAPSQGFIFCLGLAGTFGFLFLIRNEVNKLQWAKFPAVVLLIVAGLFLFSALSWGGLVKIVSLVMLVSGIYLIVSSTIRKRQDQA